MPRKKKINQADLSVGVSNKTDFYLWGLIGILLILALVRLNFIELSHGDDWADGSVLIAGENFDKIGFIESKGLPIFYPRSESVPPSVRPDKPDWTALDVFGTYTRLPALFHWINGAFQRIGWSYDNLLHFRIIALSLSVMAACAFYFFVLFISNSNRLAFLSTCLYSTNPFFISNFDSLHQNVYMDLFRNISMLLSVYFVFFSKGRSVFLWVSTFLALLFLSLTSYEYLPWMTLMLIALGIFSIINKNFFLSIKTLFLGSGIAAGLLLHFGLVSWHYGSVREAFADRLANATQRVLGNENLLGSTGGLDWGVWFEVVALRFPAQVSVVGWGWLFVFIGLGIALPLFLAGRSRTTLQLAFGMGIFFLIGAFSWYVLMPAHCIDHSGLSFLQKFLIPGMCLLLAVPIEAVFRILEAKGVPAWTRAFCYAPVAVIATMGILQSELPVTPQKIAFEREFLKVADCLRKIRPLATPQDFLACNLMRPTWMMMYYTKTRAVGVSTVEEFEKLPEKPKFFLLVPVNNPETQRLAQHLEKSYRVRSVCENQRLPFYVMERI